jgi:hypothetical protein
LSIVQPLAASTVEPVVIKEERRHGGLLGFARMGFRTGDTYQGKGVHEARRISALAQGDEILVSAETLEAARKPFAAGEPRAVSLTGIARPIQVCTVDWH